MPLAIDPNATFKVILESDKAKTPQPAFVYRFLTGRQWRELARICDQMEQETKAVARVDLTYQAIQTGLTGWENIPVAFAPANIDEVLNPIEAQEVLVKVLGQGMGIQDRKNSESQSENDTAKSAGDAGKTPPTA